jgi:predicted PurR-regulated permease PerM
VALASEHAVTPLLGVAAVYLVAQFVESYILEPIIVGAEVDINPFFTILAVVAGGLLWGVSGMILGIPILGIVRIILDNIEPLRPYAFLLGEEQKESTSSKLAKKIKSLLQASSNMGTYGIEIAAISIIVSQLLPMLSAHV